MDSRNLILARKARLRTVVVYEALRLDDGQSAIYGIWVIYMDISKEAADEKESQNPESDSTHLNVMTNALPFNIPSSNPALR